MAKKKGLYEVQKEDLRKGGVVLADAFQNDPFWEHLLIDGTTEQLGAFFEYPIRYGMKFGKVYATSKRLEGIGAWSNSEYADMTPLRGMQTSSLSALFRMGPGMFVKTMKMMKIMAPLEEDRKKNMEGKGPYIYFMVLGVATKHQGKGHGAKIIRHVIKESEKRKIPIYLETSTKLNVKVYEHMGFEVMGKTDFPEVGHPQWGLIREPGK